MYQADKLAYTIDLKRSLVDDNSLSGKLLGT